MKKIALLGICNSKNMIENAVLKDIVRDSFYVFKPCYLGITNKNAGLNIPYKDFYKTPEINDATTPFTKKILQMDLNKSILVAIETLNPDYLMIDFASLNMPTYEVSYKGKTVFSTNNYRPFCYEDLKTTLKDDFTFKEIQVTEEMKLHAIDDLANYLQNNWDLSKIILFIESVPNYAKFNNKFIEISKEEHYKTEIQKIKNVENLSEIFNQKLNKKLKVFHDMENKVIEPHSNEIGRFPSIHHILIRIHKKDKR